jgi:GT2 family glycosyltransferase
MSSSHLLHDDKRKTGLLVVTHNQREITRNFIKNYLETFSNQDVYLLVLDNNSEDDTVSILCQQFPEVDIRRLNDNYGCVTGRNIGIVELCKIGCNYIYISDNDILIKDGTFFDKMREFMEEHPNVDGCCPVVRWSDDNSVQTMGARLVSRHWVRVVTRVDSHNRINIMPGCAQCVRVSAFKRYGLFDNDLSPISIEDYEWGLRATRQGALFAYNQGVEVMHKRNRKDMKSKLLWRYVIIGRIILLRKYRSAELAAIIGFGLWPVVKHFGLRFVLESIIEGYKKECQPWNYQFDAFFQRDMQQYYYPLPVSEADR